MLRILSGEEEDENITAFSAFIFVLAMISGFAGAAMAASAAEESYVVSIHYGGDSVQL